jgi:hypothetical protein
MLALGVELEYTPVYSPWLLGEVERPHRELVQSVRVKVAESGLSLSLNYADVIPAVVSRWNTKVLSYSTDNPPVEITPYLLFFGRLPRSADSSVFPSDTTNFSIENILSTYLEIWANGRENSRVQLFKRISAGAEPFKVGTMVLRFKPPSNKVSPAWHGPYKVIEKLSDSMFRIFADDRFEDVHFYNLKPFYTDDNTEDTPEENVTGDSIVRGRGDVKFKYCEGETLVLSDFSNTIVGSVVSFDKSSHILVLHRYGLVNGLYKPLYRNAEGLLRVGKGQGGEWSEELVELRLSGLPFVGRIRLLPDGGLSRSSLRLMQSKLINLC